VAKGVRLGVGYYYPDGLGLPEAAFVGPCYLVNPPVTVTAYNDDVAGGVGTLTVGTDLWNDDYLAIPKAGLPCVSPNMWFTLPATIGNIDARSAIPFTLEKELVVQNGSRRMRLDGITVSLKLETGSTQTVVIEISDPSGLTEFPTRTLTFATGSILHSKGRAFIPCRTTADRIKVKITGSGGMAKSIEIRYIEPVYRDGGAVKIS
jgi:hypothetical protein